jgi:hypothetical protein
MTHHSMGIKKVGTNPACLFTLANQKVCHASWSSWLGFQSQSLFLKPCCDLPFGLQTALRQVGIHHLHDRAWFRDNMDIVANTSML